MSESQGSARRLQFCATFPHHCVLQSCMEIEWADSTEKHGVSRGDAVYAMTHAIVVSDRVTVEPGQTKNPRKVYLGPAHAQTEQLLEVLVEFKPKGVVRIYHVMNLGPKYRRLLEEEK